MRNVQLFFYIGGSHGTYLNAYFTLRASIVIHDDHIINHTDSNSGAKINTSSTYRTKI